MEFFGCILIFDKMKILFLLGVISIVYCYELEDTKALTRAITDCWIETALPVVPRVHDPERECDLKIFEELSIPKVLTQAITDPIRKYDLKITKEIPILKVRDKLRSTLYELLLERMIIYRHTEQFTWKETKTNPFTLYRLESLSFPQETSIYPHKIILYRISIGSDDFALKELLKRAGYHKVILPCSLNFNVDPYSGYVASSGECSHPLIPHHHNSTVFNNFMKSFAPPCPGQFYLDELINQMRSIDLVLDELNDNSAMENLRKYRKEIEKSSVCDISWH